jgi:hypothetical protein
VLLKEDPGVQISAGQAMSSAPESPLAGSISHARLARTNAVQDLLATLASGSDGQVVEMAARVRDCGADDPRIPWPAVYEIEHRVRDIAILRDAVESGDDALVGAAWARCNALWPTSIPSPLQEVARAAFRRWGRTLRRAKVRTEQASQHG